MSDNKAAAAPAAKPVTRHKVTNLQTKPAKIQSAWDKANENNKADNKFTGQTVSVIAQYTKTTLKSTDVDGQSDPYFVFQLDGFPDVALRTAYQASTLNPVAYFDRKSPIRFPLTVQSAKALAEGKLTLHVEVWDADITYDDYMGGGSYTLPKPADPKKNGTYTLEALIKDGKQRDAGVIVFYVFYDLEGQIPVGKDNKPTNLQFLVDEKVVPAGLKSADEFKKECPEIKAPAKTDAKDNKDAKGAAPAAPAKKDPLDPCTDRVKHQEVLKKTSGKIAKNKIKDLTSANEAALTAAAKTLGTAKTSNTAKPEHEAAVADEKGGVLKLISITTYAELEDKNNAKTSKVKAGQKLAAKDADGWSDPYFIAFIEGNPALWRTKVVDNSLTPEYVYDEAKGEAPTWRLTNGEVKALEAGKFVFNLEAWDEDVTYDDLIGWTNTFLKLQGGNVNQTFNIHKQLTNNAGQIKVVLKYETGVKPAAAPAPAAAKK